MKIVHAVNPVRAAPGSDLLAAQPITFASMVAARSFAAASGPAVDLCSVCFAEDEGIAGAPFRALPPLTRSVLDVGRFEIPRKLPLLADIIGAARAGSDADFCIYTNVDIGLMPSFYLTVQALIERGHDALVINRRTVVASFQSPGELPLVYAEIGEPHPGFDCFVFRREAAASFTLGDACIGAPWVGRVLLLNMLAQSHNLGYLPAAHLTFHLGDDRSWMNPRLGDYAAHNLAELERLANRLEAQGRMPIHPLTPAVLEPLRPPEPPKPTAARGWRRRLRSVLRRTV